MSDRDSSLPGTPSADAADQTVRNRSAIIRDWLLNHPAEISLDAGCGMGVYLPLLAAHSRRVFGADIILRHLRKFSGSNSQGRIQLISTALETLAVRSATFDFAVCIETLEHVQDDRRTVAELRRVLKPGGILILSVPYRGFPFETHGIRWGSRTIDSPFGLGFPLLTWFPQALRKNFATVRVYSAADLRRIFAANGLRILNVEYLLPGLDVFERKIGSRKLAGLLRTGLDALQTRLSKTWGSTIIVTAEAVRENSV